MARKVTFTLDDETVRRLALTAERLKKPKSEVVREAVAEYADRAGRLSEVERLRMLAIIDRWLDKPPTRPQREVEAEIAEIRAARRGGGRRTRND
jgi:predicted transcriptional regulator